MIYFFHHYELPVILQQAHTQDLLMRNQEGGGPPLLVAYEGGGNGLVAINRRINRNRDAAVNNNNNNNNAVNHNGGNVNVNRRMTGFNFGPFRFRLGVVLTTHQHNPGGENQLPDNSPTQNNHSHNHGHSHVHVHQHGHQHLHSHGHSHIQPDDNIHHSIESTTNNVAPAQGISDRQQEEQTNENSTPGNTTNLNHHTESTSNTNTNLNILSTSIDTAHDRPEPGTNDQPENGSGSNLVSEPDHVSPNNDAKYKESNKRMFTDQISSGNGEEKTLDKCDRAQCKTNQPRNADEDHASQNAGETLDDKDGKRCLNDKEERLEEVINNLSEISAELKSTLPAKKDN